MSRVVAKLKLLSEIDIGSTCSGDRLCSVATGVQVV